MDITPLTPKGKQVISHYGNGGFVINGTAYKGSIMILPQQVIYWPATSLAEATTDSLAPLLEGKLPELLLVGSGKQFALVPPALREWGREHKIAIDGMDTGAACRTYSVLLTEGREVAAALIAV